MKRTLDAQSEKRRIVGVVGGVGPEASNKFCEFLIKSKKAKSDQENLTFLHYCNPKIPDRTDFIIGKGPDPTPELINSCKALQESVDFLVIPCNTAHYFLPEVQNHIDIPIVDMTKLLVKRILDEYPPIRKVGILATTGSIKAEIYQEYFRNVGIEPILPSEEDQEDLVMGAVYGDNGIKAGKKMIPKKKLTEAANKLIEQGAEAIILGCTEIPLVLKQKCFDVKLFDPMEISAKEIINYIEEKEKTEMITVEYVLERPKLDDSLNVAILHHDLEWTEEELKRILEAWEHSVKLFDIRKMSLEEIKEFNPHLILNRVYASVGNRDFLSLQKNIHILEDLEKEGFFIVNSLDATKADYDKYYSFRLMSDNGISTPKTVLYKEGIDMNEVVESLGNFPLIVKRNSGGRGKDLSKCNNIKELNQAIKNIKESSDYRGHIIIQEFVKPIEDNDYRVWVIGGEFTFYHKRSLVSMKKGEAPWLASRSLGSKILDPERDICPEIKAFAEKAAETIKAGLDVLDIVKTKKGFMCIEHNPTPNVRPEYEKVLGFNILEHFLEEVLDFYNRKSNTGVFSSSLLKLRQ